MIRSPEAIDEGGALRPLAELALAEHQRAVGEIRPPVESAPDPQLSGWRRVYEGLSEPEIAEVEVLALERSHFSREGAGSPSSGSESIAAGRIGPLRLVSAHKRKDGVLPAGGRR